MAVLIEGFWKDFDIPTYNDQCANVKRSSTIKGTVELLELQGFISGQRKDCKDFPDCR